MKSSHQARSCWFKEEQSRFVCLIPGEPRIELSARSVQHSHIVVLSAQSVGLPGLVYLSLHGLLSSSSKIFVALRICGAGLSEELCRGESKSYWRLELERRVRRGKWDILIESRYFLAASITIEYDHIHRHDQKIMNETSSALFCLNLVSCSTRPWLISFHLMDMKYAEWCGDFFSTPLTCYCSSKTCVMVFFFLFNCLNVARNCYISTRVGPSWRRLTTELRMTTKD